MVIAAYVYAVAAVICSFVSILFRVLVWHEERASIDRRLTDAELRRLQDEKFQAQIWAALAGFMTAVVAILVLIPQIL